MDDLIKRQEVLNAIDQYILGKPLDREVEVRELLKLITKIYHMPSAQPEHHFCRECKWSWCHINVDKYGNIETYWRCLNWDGGTDEEGYCHEWERRTDD